MNKGDECNHRQDLSVQGISCKCSTSAHNGLLSDGTYTFAYGDTTTFAYDGDGNLLRLVDPLGNATTFTDTGDSPA